MLKKFVTHLLENLPVCFVVLDTTQNSTFHLLCLIWKSTSNIYIPPLDTLKVEKCNWVQIACYFKNSIVSNFNLYYLSVVRKIVKCK